MKDKKTTKIEELSDDQNPQYIFSLAHRDLLRKAIKGEINLEDLVKRELANRGLSLRTGLWIGFKAAKKELGL